LTNFHLPKSSLLVLVVAFLGKPTLNEPRLIIDETEMIARLQRIGEVAIQEKYRFYLFATLR